MPSVAPLQRDARPVALLIVLVAIVADRLSKLWVIAHLPVGHAIVVIPRFFRITHVLNTGAAFSLFESANNPDTVRFALVAFSVLAVVAVAAMLWITGRRFNPSTVGLALILGGALGNLYDRVRLHSVVDFLEVHIVHYHWPDFNIADSCIVAGACLLLVEAFRPQHA